MRSRKKIEKDISLNKTTKPNKTRIMVFGTFDVLHPGHLNFFRQARALAKNPYLIVSVARDANVKRIKGTRPLHSEKVRVKEVKKVPLADRIVLGELQGYIEHIVKESPAIIALGHDQKEYTSGLRQKLKEHGLVVRIRRLKPYNRNIYRSSLAKKAKFKS